MSLTASALSLAAVWGALLDPAGSRLGLLGSVIWPLAGPHLVILSGLALVLACFAFRHMPRQPALVTALIAAAAVAGTVTITGRILRAVDAAGGSVDLLRALRLSSMTAAEPDATEIHATQDGRSLRASIFRPASSGAAAPVLLYIHGGGFMIGTRLETATDLRWFADQGWLVVSVDYRLWSKDYPTWDKAPEDVACALGWVHANAARLGGDPARLAVLGDSAGGNLALNLAYGAAMDEGRTACGRPVPAPRAVVVQYPAVDPIALYEQGYPLPGFEPKMLATGYLGQRPAEVPERVRAISSATYLSPKAPPTLIIEPDNDILVPAASVHAFAGTAAALGVDMTLIRIPHANHVYNQMAANSLGNQARLTLTQHYLIRKGIGPDRSTER